MSLPTTPATLQQVATVQPINGVPPGPNIAWRGRARLVAVDATRGVALLGMIAVHSLYESDPQGHPTIPFMIFGGRAAAAFAVLAGIGIAFMTGRKRVDRSAGRATAFTLMTRALVIGAIGLALGYTDGDLAVVILPYYALMFLLAIPLVFLPTWTVAVVGTLTAAGVPAITHVLIPHLPVPELDNYSFGYLVDFPGRLISEIAITGEYPAVSWMAYLCVGLVIGRLNLARLRVAILLIGTGAGFAVGAAVASSMLLNRYGGLAHIWAAQPNSVLTVPETTEVLRLGGDGTVPASSWWWLAVDSPHTGTPLDLLGTAGSAIGLLGIMLLIGHFTWPVLRRLTTMAQAPLAAAGSMTLTLYTAHIIFINSDYDTYDAHTGYFLQVAAVLLIGLAWRATAGRGPLEGLVTMLANRARRWATAGSHRAPRAVIVPAQPQDGEGIAPRP
ncbi:heparan-alpha-glucosaminide N-acetyltransferase domain-containing protein [Rugosimonospora africana]|uniref:Heparan-alpha-glucosaminide N-acetyltransferase catalytic domain-containing protein n=1 Tax=Rugosimonospora africana TaxID=556532 RepID=A0A8J3QVH1_9ACTN|nr:heparan-alpha-glucosaminide N-acetyltransferase domain-containing protein [Rugosimonospora africana]GIH16847.1 hypothetical protein Raf01_50190 [Rugosimonospora africana]